MYGIMIRQKKNDIFLSEKQVLEKLDIPDFRHMSKDKIMAFCSMLPSMDADVIRCAFEKFPNFVEMSSGIMSCYKELIGSTIKEASSNMKSFNDSCDTIINTLKLSSSAKKIEKKRKARTY